MLGSQMRCDVCHQYKPDRCTCEKPIQVIVTGRHGSGTTTVASIITEALQKHGIQVAFQDPDVERPLSESVIEQNIPGILAKNSSIEVRAMSPIVLDRFIRCGRLGS